MEGLWYVPVAVDQDEAADVELAPLVEQRVLDVLLDHQLSFRASGLVSFTRSKDFQSN